MANTGVIIALILFVIVIIVIIVIVIASQKSSGQAVPAKFGETCVQTKTSDNPKDPQPCATGLSCIKANATDSTGICKKNEGQPCTNVSECVPSIPFCTNGFCSQTQFGGLNEPPPCNP